MDISGYLKSIDWEEESYPSYNDYLALPLLLVFFPVLHFFLDRLIFEKVGRRLIGLNDEKIDNEKLKKFKKFKESTWNFIYVVSAQTLSLLVTYKEPWFTNTTYYWVDEGNQVWPNLKIKFKLKFLYMYATGYYSYSIFTLAFWETKRSDFRPRMGHHVATAILIILSYMTRFYRPGSVVLALHVTGDIFLEIGKMSKYSGYEGVATLAFLLFFLSWILLRLVYFPFWVIWSTSYECSKLLDMREHQKDGPILYYTFNYLLYFLFYLHIYWLVLFYRTLKKKFNARGGVCKICDISVTIISPMMTSKKMSKKIT